MKWHFIRITTALIVLSIFLGSCSGLPQTVPVALFTPSPTSEPGVTIEPSATNVAALSDDVWDRIMANKKIVVGTSWDYPPFASIDPNFQVVGFDIALIQEIGRRLKIPVDIQNFAFEGLPGALKINQIDVAIAAISVTPERASQMSFSPVYYVNETALLARSDSQVANITNINQLAGLRVGVQRGTTYENMAQSLLVDTGLINKDQLLSYVRADEAVLALVANRVDLIITGLTTASYYSSQQGLRVVGKGFNQQNLAIAMRLGTPRLKAEIDRVMGEMQTDGTISGLIKEYIQNDISVLPPTPTPVDQPTATPVPPTPTVAPPACIDGMKFIADITFDDNNMKSPPFVKPGAGFVKTWRIQNSGTCTWTPNYRLVYTYGNANAAQMSGQPVNMSGNVLPGQIIDLSVTLIAPKEPFTYQGFWQIENDKGKRFGQSVWVGISTQDDLGSIEQPAGNYCEVTVTAPKNSMTVRSDFDAIWMVKNISGKDWPSNSISYKFVSGAKMHKNDVYKFTPAIKDGESGKFIVDMVAPSKPGIYNTQWTIFSDSKTLCILSLTVTVIPR